MMKYMMIIELLVAGIKIKCHIIYFTIIAKRSYCYKYWCDENFFNLNVGR